MVIFCLSVVIIGFIFSITSRIKQNPQRVNILATSDTLPSSQLPIKLIQEKPYLYIEIEVLNGCGISGLAQRFTNYLRQQGFDVVNTKNADRMNYDRTLLIERGKASEKTADVLRALMLEPGNVIHKEDPSIHADFTLVIGKDYQKLPVYSRISEMRERLY